VRLGSGRRDRVVAGLGVTDSLEESVGVGVAVGVGVFDSAGVGFGEVVRCSLGALRPPEFDGVGVGAGRTRMNRTRIPANVTMSASDDVRGRAISYRPAGRHRGARRR
jgi:hypothetical protein